MTEKAKYQRPEIKELGTVRELTLQDKAFGGSDGFTFMGIPIQNAS
jgi:hypothetical protein